MQALQCHPVRSAVYVALLIAGSLGTAHLAVAQEPTPDQQSAIRSNCRSDFMTNCSGVRSPRWRSALICSADQERRSTCAGIRAAIAARCSRLFGLSMIMVIGGQRRILTDLTGFMRALAPARPSHYVPRARKARAIPRLSMQATRGEMGFGAGTGFPAATSRAHISWSEFLLRRL